MTDYAILRAKLLKEGSITQEESLLFFQDLFNISRSRCVEICGIDFANSFPTKQYKGPGGLNDSKNGWKMGQPIGVCDHFTAADTHKSTLSWFSSYDKWRKGDGKTGVSGASSCFVVAQSGEPFLLIDFWNGKADWHEPQLNGFCIGIEHVNIGELRQKNNKFYWWPSDWNSVYLAEKELPPQAVDWRGCKWMQPFTREQIITNLVLKRALLCMYPKMRADMFVDHAMYRDDKTDCGPLWPLETLRSAAFSKDALAGYSFVSNFTSVGGSWDALDSMDLKNIQTQVINSSMPFDQTDFPTKQSQILQIQLMFNKLGLFVKADGTVNDSYVNTVKKFQSQNGLTPDGIMGPLTRQKLKDAVSKK